MRCQAGGPAPPQPAMFSGVFDDNMVLQRAPAKAAVFGSAMNLSSSTATVTVTVSSAEGSSKTYAAQVSENNMNWKVLLDPAEAGGDYTITCACTQGCVNSSVGGTIQNVTFGDVYFCSGQSNMELLLHFTFSRNDTLGAIAKGMYHNIRVRQFSHNSQTEETFIVPAGMGRLHPDSSTWLGAGQALALEETMSICPWCGKTNRSVLVSFSAACWYFGQALSDELAKMNDGKAPPIGLIASSVGGTKIELWTPVEELGNCKNQSCPAPVNTTTCGLLYNGMVAPFVNMSVKGYLWYQGENNVYEDTGNVLEHTGYGCMLPNMISAWRKAWSVEEGTTDPLAPFGVYTLAAGTSEGHGTHMGGFRWSETANYGVVPNPAMPNCFVASGYDLGDPWNKDCYFKNCCTHGVVEPQAPCSGDTRWSWWATNFFMGPIHPRPKLPFATRLAKAAAVVVYGAKGPATGPVIAGCFMSDDGKSISVKFNTKLLTSSEKVIVQEYNRSLEMMASAMEVCIGEVNPPYSPDAADKNWMFVNVMADSSGSGITVDLSTLSGSKPTAVRYAWQDYPCCGALDRTYTPCAPGSCPVMASPSMLPAMPFFALLEGGRCKCIPPQVCDG
eukprot:scpid52642/ scgid34202/ Sialate O-acetylesterase; Sialic acid-specific 9-O-acetylesterase; Yolk sac protein 2; Sialate O-acetylesterase small subunit; Sialate O-acetylesterase large subunit